MESASKNETSPNGQQLNHGADMSVLSIPCPILDCDYLHPEMLSSIIKHTTARLQTLCTETQKQTATAGLQIDLFEPSDQQKWYSILIKGSSVAVRAARLQLLAASPTQFVETVQTNAYDVLQLQSHKLKPHVAALFFRIHELTKTDIFIHSATPVSPTTSLMNIDSPNNIFIVIVGAFEQVVIAKNHILSQLDVMTTIAQSMLTFDCDPMTLRLASGRYENNIEGVANETQTNVYLPPVLLTGGKAPVIITGASVEAIEHAKARLLALEQEVLSLTPVSQSLVIPMRKLEYLHVHRRSALEKMMNKHGVTIQTTLLETGTAPQVKVAASKSFLLTKAVKDLIDLLSQDVTMRTQFPGWTGSEEAQQTWTDLLTKASQRKALNVMWSEKGMMEMCGSAAHVHQYLNTLAGANMPWTQSHMDIHIETELASEYKDFITGKKNGKLNKIIKSTSVDLQLLEPNEAVIVLALRTNNLSRAIDSFRQLMDELPAELEFFVPESHHRRIIGVSGKNIQSIMKVYGVYVKFIGAEEYRPLGGMLQQDLNVIARTPSKNEFNLKQLEQAVLQQVDKNWSELNARTLNVPRKYKRSLSKKIIHALEEEFGLKLNWSEERGAPVLKMEGRPRAMEDAITRLEQTIPETFIYRVPASESQLRPLLSSPEFRVLMEDVEQLEGIQIRHRAYQSDDEPLEEYHFIMSSCRAKSRQIQEVASRLKSLIHDFRLPTLSSDLTITDGEKAAGVSEKLVTKPNSSSMLWQSYSAHYLPKTQQNSNLATSANSDLKASESAPTLVNRASSKSPDQLFAAPISPKALGLPLGGVELTTKQNQLTIRTAVDQITSGVDQPTYLRSPMVANETLYSPKSPFYPSSARAVGYHSHGNLMRNQQPQDSAAVASPQSLFASPIIPMSAGIAEQHRRARTVASPLTLRTNLFANQYGTSSFSAYPTTNTYFGPSNPNKSKVNNPQKQSESEPIASLPTTEEEVPSSVIKSLMQLEVGEDHRLNLLLKSLDLEKFKQTFTDNDVDFQMFLTLKEEDFKELGVSLGGRKKLMAASQEIQNQQQQNLLRSGAGTPSPQQQFQALERLRSPSPINQQQGHPHQNVPPRLSISPIGYQNNKNNELRTPDRWPTSMTPLVPYPVSTNTFSPLVSPFPTAFSAGVLSSPLERSASNNLTAGPPGFKQPLFSPTASRRSSPTPTAMADSRLNASSGRYPVKLTSPPVQPKE